FAGPSVASRLNSRIRGNDERAPRYHSRAMPLENLLRHVDWGAVYTASAWTIRIAALVYVPQRRPPAAARAWLLLIFFLPWPGLVLYLLIGRAYMPRRRYRLQRQIHELARRLVPRPDRAEAAVDDVVTPELKPALRLADALSEFPPVGGCAFELLPDYDAAIARVIAEIDGARRYVHVLVYIFEDDEVGRAVADALARAARRGVAVRVLMDAIGSRRGLRHLAPALRAAGAEAIAVMPLRLWGPNVAHLEAVLLADRYLETGDVPPESNPLAPLPADPATTGLAQVVPSGPGYSEGTAEAVMVALMYGARTRVVLTSPYVVPSEAFIAAMIAAARRGVAVDLIVDAESNKPLVQLAQQSFYDAMLRAGVRIHRHFGSFLHAKHMSIDGEVALIGSSNFDIRSFALNAEVSVLIFDHGVVAALADVQARYLARCEAVTLESRRALPLPRRALENLARLTDSLL